MASCDWSRFYRQLPTAVRQLWAHLLWLQPAGPQIDRATCFGDAAAPAQANRVQVRSFLLSTRTRMPQLVAKIPSDSSLGEEQTLRAPKGQGL